MNAIVGRVPTEHEALKGIRHDISRPDNLHLEPVEAWNVKVPLRTCMTAANHAATRYDELHGERWFEKRYECVE